MVRRTDKNIVRLTNTPKHTNVGFMHQMKDMAFDTGPLLSQGAAQNIKKKHFHHFGGVNMMGQHLTGRGYTLFYY